MGEERGRGERGIGGKREGKGGGGEEKKREREIVYEVAVSQRSVSSPRGTRVP